MTCRIRNFGRNAWSALRHLATAERATASTVVAISAEMAEIRDRLSEINDGLLQLKEEHSLFQKRSTAILDQMALAAARNLAQSGDHRLIPAHEAQNFAPGGTARQLRVGIFDNLANQAYITARALRKLGHDVDVVIQENGIDSYPMARPQWEECDVELAGGENFEPNLLAWDAPEFVRYVPHDPSQLKKYAGRIEAAAEVSSLYHQRFGKHLPLDTALLLAQYMPYWDYICAMNDYDVVMLSMSAVMLGPFCPKPYIVCPLGGELYIRAFDQDVGGLLFRAGFRQAAHYSVCETDYFAYLDRLETQTPRSFMPLIVDTDIYAPGDEPEMRVEWRSQVGGERFLLSVCRQDWEWKGSDKLIKAFARFHSTEVGRDWRLVISSWGDDIEKSRQLVAELDLNASTLWLPMCSKPILRRRQRAADAVADQFVMEGYGASVLESLAAAKPVIMRPVPEASQHHFRAGAPPFIGAVTEDDVVSALHRVANPEARASAGRASREWVENEHGYATLGPLYWDMFKIAASDHRSL